MTEHGADYPKEVLDAAEAAEKERVAQLYDQALGLICQALGSLGIDNQTIAATKQANGDFVVSVLSAQQKRVPYARIGRDGVVTLLGDQIAPTKNSEPHPAESN
jgi:hypothetical protein